MPAVINPPELVFSANASSWQLAADYSTASSVAEEIHEKNKWECVYCGAHTLHAGSVLHIDNDPNNIDPANLLPVCPLCYQLFHLNWAEENFQARIIYAPGFTQAEVNVLMLARYLTLPYGAEWEDITRKVVEDLEGRAHHTSLLIRIRLKEEGIELPESFSLTPIWLAQILMKLSAKDYSARKTLLGGLRLLPDSKVFANTDEIKKWCLFYEKELPVIQWKFLANNS